MLSEKTSCWRPWTLHATSPLQDINFDQKQCGCFYGKLPPHIEDLVVPCIKDLFAKSRPPRVFPDFATAMVAAGIVAHGPHNVYGRTHAASTCACPPPRKLFDIVHVSDLHTYPTVHTPSACKAYVLAERNLTSNEFVIGGLYLKTIPAYSKCHILSAYGELYSMVDSSLLCMLSFEGLCVVGWVSVRSLYPRSTRLMGFSVEIGDMVSSFWPTVLPSASLSLHQQDSGFARGYEYTGGRKRTHEEAFALQVLAGTGEHEVVGGNRLPSADWLHNFATTYETFVQRQNLLDASTREISTAIFSQIMQDATLHQLT